MLLAVISLPELAQPALSSPAQTVKSVVAQYCVSCHDADVSKGGLDLERVLHDGVTEYSDEWENVIRKLRALDIDAAALLPNDEASHGFDNVTAGELSPTLLNRYVSAAEHFVRRTLASRILSGDGSEEI